jgi:hypothetical protein
MLGNYLCKGWFFCDLVSAIPWGLVGELINNKNSSTDVLKLLRLVKLAKLIKLLRLRKAVAVFDKLSQR